MTDDREMAEPTPAASEAHSGPGLPPPVPQSGPLVPPPSPQSGPPVPPPSPQSGPPAPLSSTGWAVPGGTDATAPTPSGWTAPPIAPPVPPPGAPYGAAPGRGAPYGAAPGHGATSNSAWTPPPRPGLLPLRPLGFGTILGAPYRALRRNPRPTFGAALLLQLGVTLVTAVVVGTTAWASFTRVESASGIEEQEALIAGGVAATLLSATLPLALSVFALGVMQGLVVLEIAGQTLGERLRFSQLWRRARGRIRAVGGWSLLVVAVSAIPLVLLAALVVGAAILLGPAGIAVAVVVAILGALAIAAAAAWLSTKLAFVPAVIVLERRTIRQAVTRSWQLTSGSFWRILGTLLLVSAILTTASQLVAVPLQLGGGITAGLLAPTGDPDAMTGVLVVVYVLSLGLSLVLSAIALVVQSGTTALLYLDQRMRLEGLDLSLSRFVEARQAGLVLADPFAPVPPTSAPGMAPGSTQAPGSAPAPAAAPPT